MKNIDIKTNQAASGNGAITLLLHGGPRRAVPEQHSSA